MGVRLKKFFNLRFAMAVLPIVIFALAFYFLSDFIGDYDFDQIWQQVQAIPKKSLLWAAGLTVSSYLLMSVYDVLGFIYVGRRLEKWKIMGTAMVAYSLSNSTGFGGVVGSAFRFRNYIHMGVKAIDVLKVIFLITIAFWLGTLVVNGVSFLIYPFQFSGIPSWMFRLLGALFLLLVAAFMAVTAFRKTPIKFGLNDVLLPPVKLSLAMILLATTDWFLGASVLYILLPDQAQTFFPIFVAIFSTSTILALLTNMPGGLGVLETMILIFVGSSGTTPHQIFGSLVVYRFIFNFCPFVLGLSAAGFLELKRSLSFARQRRRSRVQKSVQST